MINIIKFRKLKDEEKSSILNNIETKLKNYMQDGWNLCISEKMVASDLAVSYSLITLVSASKKFRCIKDQLRHSK